MKDTITKGSGNSRFLKSNIPSNTTFAQFLAMLNAGTFPFDFNGINAAGVKQMGDALSKANLLTDETAAALGLDPADNPQVDDALGRGARNFANRYLIGDTRTTVRTDLSENWALCNGATVYRDSGNISTELYALLDPGLTDREVTIPGFDQSSDIYQLANGCWSINYYSRSTLRAAVLNPLTGDLREIYTSDKGMIGSILGITWDGRRYVCCTIYNSRYLIFYTSSDLETWTEAARHAPEKSPNWGSTYGELGFVWDGAAYRVACQWSGYQATYMHTYDANFAYLTTVDTTDCGIYAADGLFCLGGESTATLYEPGSTTVLYTASIAMASGYGVFEKYGENKYVLVPIAGYSPYLRFYDKSANTLKALDIQTAFAYKKPVNDTANSYAYYFDCVNYDPETRELVFRLFTSDSANWFDARISVDADMTNADNYTLYKIPASTHGRYTHLLVHNNLWTNIRGSYIRGLHPRRLPIVTHDDVYTYIKIEEGE